MVKNRPGGKYKGSVRREKGEATLIREAEEARQKALLAYIQRQEDKRRLEMEEAEKKRLMKKRADEAKRRKFLGMFINSKKGNLQKFFKAWLQGMEVYKKDKMLEKRNRAWRQSCTACTDPACPGGCSTFQRLADISFKMPFDVAPRSSTDRQQADALWSASIRSLPALPGAQTSAPAPAPSVWSTLRSTFGGSGDRRRSSSTPALAAAAAAAATTGGGGASITAHSDGGLWPCRCEVCRKGTAGARPEINPEAAQVVIHAKTGRRCVIDTDTMRMCFADVLKRHH